MRFFYQNHGLTPLENMQKCDYLKKQFLYTNNVSFRSKRSPHIISRLFLPKNIKAKKSHFLTKIIGKISYAKMRLSKAHIFIGQKSFFFIEKTPKHYFKIIFAQKQKMKKMQFFDQNHGLTPFGKQAKMRLSKVTLFIGQK